MQGAVDYLRTNVLKGSEWSKEIAMLDLYHFLSHPNTPNQTAALHVIDAIIKYMDVETEVETITRIFDCLSSAFITHISTTCRQKMYSIMRWIWNASEGCSLILKNKSQSILLRGLGDSDPNIGQEIKVFLNTSFHFDEAVTSSRILNVFENLLHPDCEDSFLQVFPDLILSMSEKSPEYARKIYEDPLEDCIFKLFVQNLNYLLYFYIIKKYI